MNFEKFLASDGRLSARLRVAEKPGLLRTIAMFFAHSGDSWFWIASLALIWYTGNTFWKWRALILGLSILVTAVTVLVIKFTVKRRRPEGEWGGIYRSTDPHSFPSGHAARSFLLATMAIGLGPPWFAIVLVIWAPLVGVARVLMGVHYLSDVIAGGLLGIVMGWVNYHLIPTLVTYLV